MFKNDIQSDGNHCLFGCSPPGEGMVEMLTYYEGKEKMSKLSICGH